MRANLTRGLAAAAASVLVSSGLAVAVEQSAQAAVGCGVTYAKNDWGSGFTANITLTNLGDALSNWTLTYAYTGNQTLTSGWSGTWSQSGKNITVTSASWNGALATNASTTLGAQFTYSGTNTDPASFAINGTTCTGSATTSPTTTPTSPTTSPTDTATAQPGTHVDNPYAGATGYINPDYAAEVQAAASAKGGSLGTSMAKVANYPTAVWLDRIAAVTGGTGVTRTLAGHLDAALAQQSGSTPVVITLVVYDLPNRDCAASASNGELTIANDGLNKYKTQYIDPLVSVLSQAKYANLRIATIVEPDSLPNLVTNLSLAKCSEANSSGAYVQGIQYAVNKLHALSNVYQYIDIAHSAWLGWDSNFQPAVNLISNTIKGTTAGVNSIDGFISDTANYTPTDEPYLPNSSLTVGGNPIRSATFYEWNPYFDEHTYANAMRTAFVNAGFPSGIGMLIDTSRNGWGGSGRPTAVSTSTDLNTYVNQSKIDRRYHRGNWCNQPGGIGARPTASPMSGFDAYVWIKPPGESDGTSDSSQTTPDPEGKSFDKMCDPNGQSTYNSAYPTGAMAGAPAAGHWFETEFETLVTNAYPAL
jgi:cellulose 1,4-beta-cellobiosidase